jgi:hypothetical protein
MDAGSVLDPIFFSPSASSRGSIAGSFSKISRQLLTPTGLTYAANSYRFGTRSRFSNTSTSSDTFAG